MAHSPVAARKNPFLQPDRLPFPAMAEAMWSCPVDESFSTPQRETRAPQRETGWTPQSGSPSLLRTPCSIADEDRGADVYFAERERRASLTPARSPSDILRRGSLFEPSPSRSSSHSGSGASGSNSVTPSATTPSAARTPATPPRQPRAMRASLAVTAQARDAETQTPPAAEQRGRSAPLLAPRGPPLLRGAQQSLAPCRAPVGIHGVDPSGREADSLSISSISGLDGDEARVRGNNARDRDRSSGCPLADRDPDSTTASGLAASSSSAKRPNDAVAHIRRPTSSCVDRKGARLSPSGVVRQLDFGGENTIAPSRIGSHPPQIQQVVCPAVGSKELPVVTRVGTQHKSTELVDWDSSLCREANRASSPDDAPSTTGLTGCTSLHLRELSELRSPDSHENLPCGCAQAAPMLGHDEVTPQRRNHRPQVEPRVPSAEIARAAPTDFLVQLRLCSCGRGMQLALATEGRPACLQEAVVATSDERPAESPSVIVRSSSLGSQTPPRRRTSRSRMRVARAASSGRIGSELALEGSRNDSVNSDMWLSDLQSTVSALREQYFESCPLSRPPRQTDFARPRYRGLGLSCFTPLSEHCRRRPHRRPRLPRAVVA